MHSVKIALLALAAGIATASPVAAPREAIIPLPCTYTTTFFPGFTPTATVYTHSTTIIRKADCKGCKNIFVISNGGIAGGIPPVATVTSTGTGTKTKWVCKPTLAWQGEAQQAA